MNRGSAPSAAGEELRVDACVIGAGFGGLSAALALAERGAKVLLCESLKYPGGCASTFVRGGCRFEAGATLFSGFDEGQPFRTWIDRHAMDVTVDPIDPMVELRTGAMTLAVGRERSSLIDAFCAMPDAPVDALRRFFTEQRAVADALWALFREPALLPPLSARALVAHIARLPAYAPILRVIGRSVRSVLARHELEGFEPLRQFLDAVLQITVQTASDDAEAPFGLSSMDYYFRGTGHVRGGIGSLASAMVTAIERSGGSVRMTDRVSAIERDRDGWIVRSRRGTTRATHVIANVLPEALEGLRRERYRETAELAELVANGWGAAMLYLVIEDDPSLPSQAKHYELVHDPSRPFTDGNHVFVSLSSRDETERAGPGQRTATCSTHVYAARLRAMTSDQQRAYIERVQDAMRCTMRARASDVYERTKREETASPRTFERFTGRPGGYVGGVPRRVGLAQYGRLWPTELERGLWLVGDSVGLGQSTLATALTAIRTVDSIAKSG
ncbi:MAG: FAD-dependent oxidoreductase [Myxococcales bacterium]|nr:FAD-dependent oxidoreductase [Myxococcales bacterium]